jgi:DNA-binding beta-propeller fold protein YncE
MCGAPSFSTADVDQGDPDRKTTISLNGHYEPVVGWPIGIRLGGDATSVAVDPEDNVYIFNRGPVPMLIFDPNGNRIDGWGGGEFVRPHGLTLDTDGDLFLVDNKGHFVQKRSREGRLAFTLGTPRQPARRQSGIPFHEPTDLAVHEPTGDLFITDGYGNSRVHHYNRSGELFRSWGESGSRPGQFSLPHGIVMLPDDRMAMCDRENFRIQVFDLQGRFIDQWHSHHPLAIRRHPTLELLFVAEMGPHLIQENVANLGNRVTIFTFDGDIVDQFGAPTPGQGVDQFICPHGIAIDSRGDVYVAEVSASYLASPSSGNRTETVPVGEELVSLRKWRFVSDAA